MTSVHRVLTTDAIAPFDRARLVIEGLAGAGGVCRVTHLCEDAAVWARWSRLHLSPSTDLLYHQGSAIRIARRFTDVVRAPSARLAFTVPGSAGGLLWQYGLQRLGADALVVVDLAAPYDFRVGAGTRSAVQIDRAALGVSVELVRAVAPLLQSSPLYPLARDHVRTLVETTTSWDAGLAAGDDLVQATTDLLGALLRSCTTSVSPLRYDSVAPQVGLVRHRFPSGKERS